MEEKKIIIFNNYMKNANNNNNNEYTRQIPTKKISEMEKNFTDNASIIEVKPSKINNTTILTKTTTQSRYLITTTTKALNKPTINVGNEEQIQTEITEAVNNAVFINRTLLSRKIITTTKKSIPIKVTKTITLTKDNVNSRNPITRYEITTTTKNSAQKTSAANDAIANISSGNQDKQTLEENIKNPENGNNSNIVQVNTNTPNTSNNDDTNFIDNNNSDLTSTINGDNNVEDKVETIANASNTISNTYSVKPTKNRLTEIINDTNKNDDNSSNIIILIVIPIVFIAILAVVFFVRRAIRNGKNGKAKNSIYPVSSNKLRKSRLFGTLQFFSGSKNNFSSSSSDSRGSRGSRTNLTNISSDGPEYNNVVPEYSEWLEAGSNLSLPPVSPPPAVTNTRINALNDTNMGMNIVNITKLNNRPPVTTTTTTTLTANNTTAQNGTTSSTNDDESKRESQSQTTKWAWKLEGMRIGKTRDSERKSGRQSIFNSFQVW